MRNAGLIGGPDKCGSDARGECQGYFIQNGRMQMNTAADGCKIKQLPFAEPILPGATVLETLAPSPQRTSQVRMSSLQNLLLFLGALPG
jgi:hypothetical protein